MTCKDPTKQQFHFVTMNLHKEKHADLIEWLKSTADEEEQSLSSLCIKLLKRAMKSAEGADDGK